MLLYGNANKWTTVHTDIVYFRKILVRHLQWYNNFLCYLTTKTRNGVKPVLHLMCHCVEVVSQPINSVQLMVWKAVPVILNCACPSDTWEDTWEDTSGDRKVIGHEKLTTIICMLCMEIYPRHLDNYICICLYSGLHVWSSASTCIVYGWNRPPTVLPPTW